MAGNGLRRYHAAVWDEPLVMELGAPGRRGMIFPDPDPEMPQGFRLRQFRQLRGAPAAGGGRDQVVRLSGRL